MPSLEQRLVNLERAAATGLPRLLVVEGEPTDEQRRLIDTAERTGEPMLVIRLVFG